jgi:hypothetical protein
LKIEDRRLRIPKARHSNRQSTIGNRQFLLSVLLLLAALASACAGRRQPVFAPVAREEAQRALSAWSDVVARAEARGVARLLYEARVSRGPFRMSGTLAVQESPAGIEATLSGPFGDAVARYEDGALRGDGIRPIRIDPDELRWLLAGIWKGREAPVVAGMAGEEALLRWTGKDPVDGVLDVARGRFKSVRVTRPEGSIVATYSGQDSSWPGEIELEDLGSGNTLRLKLVAAEK